MNIHSISMLIATLGLAHAAPEGLTTAIPAFLDTNQDGVITELERQAFTETRREAAAGGAAAWDLDGDGVVDAVERQTAIQKLQARADARRAEIFNQAAGDDGLLSEEEFRQLPAVRNMPEERIILLFKLLDVKNAGAIDLESFLMQVRGGGVKSPGSSGPGGPPRPETPGRPGAKGD